MIQPSSAARFLTYNIRLTLEEGVDSVVQTLKEINADVVALQEVGDFWPMGPDTNLTEAIAEAAGYPHHFFAGALFEGGGAYGIALLSRWPIHNTRIDQLPREIDEQRVLLQAEVGDPGVALWTTHLSVKKPDRDQQLQWLLLAMETQKPDILLGDLNTSLTDPLLARLPLRSTYRGTPPATYPAIEPSETIDHILHSDGFALHQKAQTHPSNASDHLPVFTDMKRS